MLSEGMKTRILAQLPNILVSDVAGASETGAQMGTNSTSGSVSTGRFVPGPGATVVSEDLTRELDTRATRTSAGWPRRGRSPSATWATPRSRRAPSP